MIKKFKLSDDDILILHLMSKSIYLSDLGLFHGKMGVLLSFLHYNKTNEEVDILETIADDLLYDIFKRVNRTTDPFFASGLSGIGWGIEYLVQNHFYTADLDVLSDIDRKIEELDPRRIKDLSIEVGLGGILHYVIIRLNRSINDKIPCPFDLIYLNDLSRKLTELKKSFLMGKNLDLELIYLIEVFLEFMTDSSSFSYNICLKKFINNTNLNIDYSRVHLYPVGLNDGISGLLLSRIL